MIEQYSTRLCGRRHFRDCGTFAEPDTGAARAFDGEIGPHEVTAKNLNTCTYGRIVS
jgi:hypothetical protein